MSIQPASLSEIFKFADNYESIDWKHHFSIVNWVNGSYYSRFL